MNVSEIIQRVKRSFGDESGVQLIDNDIITWINDASRQIAAQAELLQTRAAADLVQNQLIYDMPDNLLNLRAVRVAGVRLTPMSMQEADDKFPGWDGNAPFVQETGVPLYWWPWDGQIYLYPLSDTSTTAGITLYYSRIPVAVTSTADTPELPEQYHDHIFRYCMRMAYELDENIQAANFSEGLLKQGLDGLAEDENKISDEFYSTIVVRAEDA